MNISTFIVLAVVVFVIAAIIVKLKNDKKQGKSSCGCGCESCAMKGSCHTSKK